MCRQIVLYKSQKKKENKSAKKTVIKIAYRLHLPLDDTKVLLNRAGYSFSNSKSFDIIINYCLEKNLSTWCTDEILYSYLGETILNDASVTDKVYIPELNERLSHHVPDFAKMINTYQEQKGLSNADVCRFVDVNESYYTNIIKERRTHPQKDIVIKIAYGLELSLNETEKLLNSAGFSFSDSDYFDVIIKYCLEKGLDLWETDQILDNYLGKTLFSLL